MIKLKFFKPQELEKTIRLAVHKSGRLGFSIEASDKLELSLDKSAGIAVNEESDGSDETLYLVIFNDLEEGNFKIGKTGDYFYINTKLLFDNLGIDYKTESVSFDMKKIKIEDQDVYELKRVKKEEKESKGEIAYN